MKIKTGITSQQMYNNPSVALLKKIHDLEQTLHLMATPKVAVVKFHKENGAERKQS